MHQGKTQISHVIKILKFKIWTKKLRQQDWHLTVILSRQTTKKVEHAEEKKKSITPKKTTGPILQTFIGEKNTRRVHQKKRKEYNERTGWINQTKTELNRNRHTNIHCIVQDLKRLNTNQNPHQCSYSWYHKSQLI